MSTNTARIAALETSVATLVEGFGTLNTTQARILALLEGSAPAQVTPEVTAPVTDEKPFVEWIRETAEARAARKTSNREMAAWLRGKNLPTNGPVWEAAKKGERSVRVLRKLAK